MRAPSTHTWLTLAFPLVIFNLIDDTSKLIDNGWIPVVDTSNGTLTENLLSSLDLLQTNATHLAVRTPLSSPHSKAVHIEFNTSLANTSSNVPLSSSSH
jgi:hypothetical protein